MQEIHRPLKENLQKDVQNPQWGREAPPPRRRRGVDFVHLFVDFPCAVCGFPAYLPVYICEYVYVYFSEIFSRGW